MNDISLFPYELINRINASTLIPAIAYEENLVKDLEYNGARILKDEKGYYGIEFVLVNGNPHNYEVVHTVDLSVVNNFTVFLLL